MNDIVFSILHYVEVILYFVKIVSCTSKNVLIWHNKFVITCNFLFKSLTLSSKRLSSVILSSSSLEENLDSSTSTTSLWLALLQWGLEMEPESVGDDGKWLEKKRIIGNVCWEVKLQNFYCICTILFNFYFMCSNWYIFKSFALEYLTILVAQDCNSYCQLWWEFNT